MMAGKLRHYVSIEVPFATKNTFSEKAVEWQLFNKVWANIETLNGRDKAVAAASWPSATNKISMRYLKGLLPTMRIRFEDTIYSILNVNDVELRHRDIEITAESGVKAQ